MTGTGRIPVDREFVGGLGQNVKRLTVERSHCRRPKQTKERSLAEFKIAMGIAFARRAQLCYIGRMPYEERIREARPRMSKSFARLADFLLDSHVRAALMTATELAHQVDVDAATVVRFAQFLGYDGFPELQREIKERVLADYRIRPKGAPKADSIPGVVHAALEQLKEAVEQVQKMLDSKAVARLVAQMGSARRIILLPESLGQAAAYNLAAFLEEGGFLVTMTPHGVTDLARTVLTASTKDLVLAIDVAGEAPFIARALTEAKARKIPTAAIVGAPSLKAAQVADTVLAAPGEVSAGMAIVTVDAVVYTLAEALRFEYAERFKGTSEAVVKLFERLQVGGRG